MADKKSDALVDPAPVTAPVVVPPPLKARVQVTGVIKRTSGYSVELTQVGGKSISASAAADQLTPSSHAPTAAFDLDVTEVAAGVLGLGAKFDIVFVKVE